MVPSRGQQRVQRFSGYHGYLQSQREVNSGLQSQVSQVKQQHGQLGSWRRQQR